ncbi:hypothetical protein ACH9D2_04410 [Kocuria sp. M4R2S49]|uniref:hypothetical protein n=1 Tax=Kocuria rhizosphaericola TaxID=3376284 RepID=UPI0037ACA4E8
MTVPHDGRELLRLEVRNARARIGKHLERIRRRPQHAGLQPLVRARRRRAVCHGAGRRYRHVVGKRASG